jgi:hypothetical protein
MLPVGVALLAGFVVLVASVPYLPTLDDYFLQEDFGMVWLLSREPWTTFPTWFVSSWTEGIWGAVDSEIRPFPGLTFQLGALWGAASPVANHAINIALHVATALLVFWIARRSARLDVRWAAVAAAIFAAHPIQAETVAWMSGRADSLPACFYLAALGSYARWRRRGGRASYALALALFIVALFSKANTITFAAALVAYDVLIERRPVRLAWSWAAPYLPFTLVTAGHLALRRALFGAFVRENLLTREQVRAFLDFAREHVEHLVLGESGRGRIGLYGTLLALAVVTALVVARRRRPAPAGADLGVPAYFGIVWIGLGIAPILVAGYYSPRHMYLASVGWAITLAFGLERLWWARRPGRVAATGVAAVILVAYLSQLVAVVRVWEFRSDLSREMLTTIEREARAAPQGSLILAGVPSDSWFFALPYSLRRPFASVDIGQRVAVIYPAYAHCCGLSRWDAHTRRVIRAWLDQPTSRPVIALYWDPVTGEFSRVTDATQPSLRPQIAALLKAGDSIALEDQFPESLGDVVVPPRR